MVGWSVLIPLPVGYEYILCKPPPSKSSVAVLHFLSPTTLSQSVKKIDFQTNVCGLPRSHDWSIPAPIPLIVFRVRVFAVHHSDSRLTFLFFSSVWVKQPDHFNWSTIFNERTFPIFVCRCDRSTKVWVFAYSDDMLVVHTRERRSKLRTRRTVETINRPL